MPRIVRNTILNYNSDSFKTENIINPARIFEVNKNNIKKGYIVYLCEREIRVKDNFALQFGIQKSKELNLPLKIIYSKISYDYEPKQKFIENQILHAQEQFKKTCLDF